MNRCSNCKEEVEYCDGYEHDMDLQKKELNYKKFYCWMGGDQNDYTLHFCSKKCLPVAQIMIAKMI